MDDESDCEVDRPDSASKLRDWQLLHAHQERERQWIAGVMRDLHRRTPRRNPPPPLTVAAGRTTPFSPAAAPSPRSPSPLSPAGSARLQASASPEPSRAGPLSEHTGPLSSGSWRDPGDHSQLSPPFLARTAEGLPWLGGPDVGAATFGSSQSGATTTGGGGGSLSYLGNGGSGGSPVDVRSAGRGALGLTSPPSGQFRHEGEEEKEEEEGAGGEYSPPQPRAFWREEWHGGGSGGSGGRGNHSQGNRSRGGGGGGSNSPSRRREKSADLFGVDVDARDRKEDHRMGGSERFTTAAVAAPATDAATPLRRLGRVSAETGVGTARCWTRNASRDSIGGQGHREGGASGGNSIWSKSGKGRGKNGDISSGLDDGFCQSGFDKATGNGGSGGGSGGSNSSGVLSAAGFALLASVAVAAFAVGALLAPPPPRQRSVFPSAAPLEYARQRPSPGYEPTMVERRENRGKSQRAKLRTVQTSAASAPQASTVAAEDSRGGSDARYAATVAAPSGGEAIASPSDSFAGSSTTGCPSPAANDVGGRRQPATTWLSPFLSARDAATATTVAGAGAAVGASLPGTDADNSRRGRTYPGAFEPTARAASQAWNRDVGDPRWRRWRRRARPPVTQRLVVGVDPDAFARTLGSAESSLIFLSDGHDRQAQRDAWRIAASESAATTACKAMASSSVTSASEGGQRADGPCDTGAAASKNRGGRRGGAGGARGTAHMFPFFPAQGGTPTLFSQYTIAAAAAAAALQPVPALSAVTASTMVAQKRGTHTEDASRAPSVQQTERGPQTPLARKNGGGEQLESTSPPATQRETSDYRRSPPAVNGRGRGPALPPPCSGLVLSGNDVQASWAGLYTLAPVREARAAPGSDPSATPLIERPVYFRVRALPPPFGVEEEWEGGEGQGTSEVTDSVTPGRTDAVSHGRIDAVVPNRIDFVSADQTDSVSVDWTDTVAPGWIDSVFPDRIDSVNTPDRTDSISAGRTDSDSDLVIPEWSDSVTSGRTDSVSASGEASGGVISSMETPFMPTPDDAAPLPPPTSGDQQQQLGEPVSAAEDIVLCLYWADASGGRWVLDDDVNLSNGVLGVTKDAAPASPYLAFPNHHHHQNHNHHTHNQHQQPNHHHRGSRAGGGSGRSRSGGAGGDDGVSQRPRVDGAGDGERLAGAALSPLPSSFSPSPWLLDSPRLQGWAEAEDVVVVCETD